MVGSIHPSILWAQRNDTILLTVNLSDITDEKFSLVEKRFTFSATSRSDGLHYACELEFLKEVVPQVCVCVCMCVCVCVCVCAPPEMDLASSSGESKVT